MKNLLMPFAFFSALSCAQASTQVHAQVYESTNKQGVTSFSDQASKGAQERQIQPSNMADAPTINNRADSKPNDKALEAPYINISEPTDGSQIPPSVQELTFTWQSNVAKEEIARIQLWMDHRVVAETTSTKSISLPLALPQRGQRHFHIHVLDEQGNTITQSKNISLHILRAGQGKAR